MRKRHLNQDLNNKKESHTDFGVKQFQTKGTTGTTASCVMKETVNHSTTSLMPLFIVIEPRGQPCDLSRANQTSRDWLCERWDRKDLSLGW